MQALPPHVYAVILAGGSGTRFWPKSRHRLPKQLCKIGDSQQTMIELTLERLDGLIPPDRRLIVTHQEQVGLTREIVGTRCLRFIAEPVAKNTAPALTLAALEIQQLAANENQKPAIMISLHADALIQKLDVFHETIHKMYRAAEHGYLTLLGVKPEYPETGYGYIERGDEISTLNSAHKVKSFREKPDRDTAEHYLAQGNFLWNSGIFAWKTETVIEELERFLPGNTKILQELVQNRSQSSIEKIDPKIFEEVYQRLQSIAIDPAVLERSQKVAVIDADIGWKDVGSWDALDQCFTPDANRNLVLTEDAIIIDSEGITVDSDADMVACLGLKDLVIVSSKGAILVCAKEKAQDVKKIVEQLKQRGRNLLALEKLVTINDLQPSCIIDLIIYHCGLLR